MSNTLLDYQFTDEEMLDREMLNQVCENITSLFSFENTGNHVVYVHINMINQKKYIGITCQNPPEKRWLSGHSYSKCPEFKNAIEQYGWNNFEHLILFNKLDYKTALAIEKYMIKELKLQDLRYGYNVSDGGDVNCMLGKHHTKQARQKMSQALFDRYAENPKSHPWIGRHHSDESIERMRQSSYRKCKIMCVETEEIFPSINEATRQMGLKSKNSIILALNNPDKTAKKYHWIKIKEEM